MIAQGRCPTTPKRVRPNQRLQRTALCAREIGAFLKDSFGPIVLSIYDCAAAEARAVGRAPSMLSPEICFGLAKIVDCLLGFRMP